MPDYASQEYWESYYKRKPQGSTAAAENMVEGDIFEWLFSPEVVMRYLRPLLQQHFEKRICVTGCGNSELGIAIRKEGYTPVINIDYSPTVIAQMAEKYRGIKGLEWLEMDVRRLEFRDESLDAIIDKGTLDAVDCGLMGEGNVARVVGEAYRTLKQGGLWCLFSLGTPEMRLPALQRAEYTWTISHYEITEQGEEINVLDPQSGHAMHHHYYLMRKEAAQNSGADRAENLFL